MNHFRGRDLIHASAAVLSGCCASFIYYCEKLQFFPGSARGFFARLGIVGLAGAALSAVLIELIRQAASRCSAREWLPILLGSLVLSVYAVIWFPAPNTGIYPEHTLEIRTIPDSTGTVGPVTLTWINRKAGDVPLSVVRCEGGCTWGNYGPTLQGLDAALYWTGKTGETVTIEFVSDPGQGIAEIHWDDTVQISPLNHEELSRLSFDHAFPPSSGLTEFIAVWLLYFQLSLAALIIAVKLFPGWQVRAFLTGAFVVFAVFRVCQFLTVEEPLFFVDSESYLGMSQMSVMDILRGTPYCHQQYWYCIARPAFIPLVYKFCHQDPQTITIAQLILSILCWGFFAWCAAGLCRRDLFRKIVFALALGLGCVPNVTRWDRILMSESLAISACLLMMGALFWLTKPLSKKRWCVRPALTAAVGTLLYANSRDSAVWIVILIALLLLCVSGIRTNRKVVLCLCAVLAVICWSMMNNTGNRWQYPFENVLFNRILTDPQGEAFFKEAGMPMPSGIEKLYGVEHMMGSELFNSAEMAPLREWILSDGLKTYIRYMLKDPAAVLKLAGEAFEREAFEVIDYTFAPKGFEPLLPDPLNRFFSCNLPWILVFGASLAGLFMAFRRSDGIRYVFPLLFILSAYILCTGVLIADEYEFSRHAMVIILMMKASIWPLAALLIEDLGPENKCRGAAAGSKAF